MTTAQHKRLSVLERTAPDRYEPVTVLRVLVCKDGSRKPFPPRTVPAYPAGVKRPRA